VEPKFDLNVVKSLFQRFMEGEEDCVWFSCLLRSTERVSKIFECTVDEAIILIHKGINQLSNEDFCKRIIMWGDSTCIADEYGTEFADHNWYVKLMIEDDCPDQISFHPLEKDMTLSNGKTLVVTYDRPDE
jgi:hypothetical protein